MCEYFCYLMCHLGMYTLTILPNSLLVIKSYWAARACRCLAMLIEILMTFLRIELENRGKGAKSRLIRVQLDESDKLGRHMIPKARQHLSAKKRRKYAEEETLRGRFCPQLVKHKQITCYSPLRWYIRWGRSFRKLS